MNQDETKQADRETSLVGDSSDKAVGITSTEKTPETLTQEQIVEKAVSDALSKAGRTAKSLSELETRLNTGLAELTAQKTAWQKEKDEAEEYELRDQPEELTALRKERQRKADAETKATELTTREAKIAERETEFADIIAQHKILKRTELAAEVAVEKGVSMDAILKLAKEDTREAYEAVAEVLPKTDVLPVLLTDSGRTNRGGEPSFTRLQLENPDFFDEHRAEIYEAQRAGRIK